MDKTVLVIFASVVITATIIGGGVYIWQQEIIGGLKEDNLTLKGSVSDLQNELKKVTIKSVEQISDLKERVIELEAGENKQGQVPQQEQDRRACKGLWTLDNKCVEKKIRIISPKAGEGLCLGNTYNVEWSGDPNMGSIRLLIRPSGAAPVDTYSIGSFPVSYNETGSTVGYGIFAWRVGKVESTYVGTPATKDLTEREAYEIIINGTATINNVKYGVSDVSGVFAIRNCQG